MELTDGHWFNSKPAAPKVSIGATPSLAIGKFFSGISDELSREGLLQRNTAQCSPIPGIPEEVASTNSNQKRLNSSRLLNDSLSGKHNHLEGNKNARPMPDMHAFEGDASTSSLSDDTSINSPLRRASKLQCPPTPVRTPIVYAHMEQGPGSHVKFSRNNSLTVTKVLATCPPRVRQGRESLENSVLDDDVEQPQKRSMGSDVATELDSDDEELWHASPFELSLLPQQQQQQQLEPVVSMVTHFTVLSALGSGAFADVYRVRSKVDGALYAVKRNRRQFRSKRDREKAMNEVKWMQLLQRAGTQENESNRSYSLFLLFFYQAWQEDGHFYVQTELCCRDTCRGLMDSLRSKWPVAKSRYPCLSQLPPIPAKELRVGAVPDLRMFPEDTIWKIFHDVAAGLSHIHSHGLVHFDIKPENCFLVSHGRLGAMVKIGDFGLAGAIGSSEDGQEGDTKYMPPELLLSDKKHPSADIFSLGLTLYEIASCPSFHLPSEGALWHELRNGQHSLNIPTCRSKALFDLIQASIRPEKDARPTADSILNIDVVATVGGRCDTFLRDYLHDVEDFDAREEFNFGGQEDKTPRHAHRKRVCSPTISNIFGNQTLLYSPETAS
jgi:membrane-associated tyrosine/threonine-specific cdc2-inhibitory kinase